MRSVLFRFPDLEAFERLMGAAKAGDVEIAAPRSEDVDDGEWLLAVFEIGPHRRATSVAARASVNPESTKVLLEPRDCRRLAEFARLEASRPAAQAGPAATTRLGGGAPARSEEEPPPRTERSVTTPPPAAVVAPPTPVPSRGPLPSGAGAKILVVDDEADIRDMVAAMLEAVGLVVSTAGSAEEALGVLAEQPIDLLVLDWNMPRMTGLDLCRAVRLKPGIATLPVLILTANTSSTDMVEAFAAGADDYVMKPFRAPELGARIFSLLRRARMVAGQV